MWYNSHWRGSARNAGDPWGSVAADRGAAPARYQYTGQEHDATGLYDYHARAYDPLLGRFVSADTIVPGAADGAGGGAATLGYDPKTRLTPLTTNLGEFAAQVNEENREIAQYGWFFQWDGKVREQHNVPMGPVNPQALNRYAYCLNNPLRYVDPSGHEAGGNEDIGYESLEDQDGNPILVNGQQMFKIWYYGEEAYVSNSADMAEFMAFADSNKAAIESIKPSLRVMAVGIAGTIIGGCITLGSLTLEGPFGIPGAILGRLLTGGSFAATYYEAQDIVGAYQTYSTTTLLWHDLI